MEYEELVGKLEDYPTGTVLNIFWDRCNGELSGYYVCFRKDLDEKPILKRYEKGKSLEDYVDVVAFDIYNPFLNITDVRVTAYKSVELIGD